MGEIGDRCRARARRAKSEAARLPREAGALLETGCVAALDAQLYARTTLPTTGRMRRSVGTVETGEGVAVGFDSSLAPHAPARLARRGASKSDGHDMTLDIPGFIRARSGAALHALGERCQKRITGA